MTTIEAKVDAMARMMLGTTDEERAAARRTLCNLLDKPVLRDKESVVCEMLRELGVPCGNVGHQYLVDAIVMVSETPSIINNMTRSGGLYIAVAEKNNTTHNCVERGIRHSIEVFAKRCDPDIVFKSFGNTINPHTGKPTNKEFVARLAGLVRQKVK